MKRKLKSLIRTKLLGYDINTVFFAQGGEDATLLALFREKIEKKETGFFVDIGAYHPVLHSNTYLFYRENWNGINIDARPGSMLEFEKKRPKDINLELGVGLISENKTFYQVKIQATMNSFSKENILLNGISENDISTSELKIDTLSTILLKHLPKGKKIDFLSVDVEGFDMEVLQSNDWNKFVPSVIIVEIACKKLSELIEHPISKYLEVHGYELVAKNIILSSVGSVFYVHNTLRY